MHVLFGLDQGGVPAFDGEPVLLVDHRPGDDPSDMTFEPADVIDEATALQLDLHRVQFAECMSAAFTRDGSFDPERLIAQRIHIESV